MLDYTQSRHMGHGTMGTQGKKNIIFLLPPYTHQFTDTDAVIITATDINTGRIGTKVFASPPTHQYRHLMERRCEALRQSSHLDFFTVGDDQKIEMSAMCADFFYISITRHARTLKLSLSVKHTHTT